METPVIVNIYLFIPCSTVKLLIISNSTYTYSNSKTEPNKFDFVGKHIISTEKYLLTKLTINSTITY